MEHNTRIACEFDRFLASFCVFIGKNLNEPRLYGFFEIGWTESGNLNEEFSKFSEMMPEIEDVEYPGDYVHCQFLANIGLLKVLAKFDLTGWLEWRLDGLEFIHEHKMKKFFQPLLSCWL